MDLLSGSKKKTQREQITNLWNGSGITPVFGKDSGAVTAGPPGIRAGWVVEN